ncbi:MAG: hypothetical protein Q4A15_00930 [Prevotellaceae bacterium]|nr:hypothetical protein [Prevotellaceae bacterium]
MLLLIDFKLNAMDNLDEINEQLKSLDQAEKDLKIERWYRITIERKDHKDGSIYKLYHYDFPKDMLDRWRWLINWREAKFQCQYPRDYIYQVVSCYDKNSKQDYKKISPIISCKAWVTRARKAVEKYEKERATELFWDKENDEIYQKAIKKLADKEEKLKQAIERELKNGTN